MSIEHPPAKAPHGIPALVFCHPETAGVKIAGLTVLDRLVVALHRGGAGRIMIVSDGELPELKRTRALGIVFDVAREPLFVEQSLLLASANLLVQPADVRKCIENRARLVTASGEKLPIGCARVSAGTVDEMLRDVPVTSASAVAGLVQDRDSAAVAERTLWASMTSSADGIVDRVFNRPAGRALSRLLIHTPASPNAVSIVSILIGLVAAFLFARGDHQAIMIGAILFQLSAIVDCVDGDIARILFKESPLGKWLDLAGDQIVHVSVFAGIALGVARSGESPWLLWLGASAVLGALISFAVVVRGMRSRSMENSLLQRLVDSATNRDFSVIVLVLACFRQLDWFLWMAAIGSHVFWITALALQMRPRSRTEFAG